MPESDADECYPLTPPHFGTWPWTAYIGEKPVTAKQMPLENRKPVGRSRRYTSGPFEITIRSIGDFHDVILKHEAGWSVAITEAASTNLVSDYVTIYNPPEGFEVYKQFMDQETGKPTKQLRMKDF